MLCILVRVSAAIALARKRRGNIMGQPNGHEIGGAVGVVDLQQ